MTNILCRILATESDTILLPYQRFIWVVMEVHYRGKILNKNAPCQSIKRLLDLRHVSRIIRRMITKLYMPEEVPLHRAPWRCEHPRQSGYNHSCVTHCNIRMLRLFVDQECTTINESSWACVCSPEETTIQEHLRIVGLDVSRGHKRELSEMIKIFSGHRRR